MFTHGIKPFANIAPYPGIDQCDAPVLLGIAQRLDVGAENRDHAVRIDVGLVLEEEIFDDVGFVAQTKDEVLVAELAVVAHEVPKDRLAADGYHRLWHVLGIIADPRAETPAEENCFHWRGPEDLG